MATRLLTLSVALLVVFGFTAVFRFALNIPSDRRGYDAIDYVILHGSVQHGDLGGRSVRPSDVTGVYIHDGFVNKRTIDMLNHLPNLRHITIEADDGKSSAGQTPTRPLNSHADLKRMQDAFPDLDVRVAQPRSQKGV